MTAFFARTAATIAAIAAAATLMPAAASAQSYGYGNSYNQGYSQPQTYNNGGYNNGSYNNGYGQTHDRCRTLGQGRTGAGVLIGGGLGAIAGSQIAARGNRTEGSIIGGVLGAIIGSQVGRASNNQCQTNGYQGQTAYSHNDRYDDRAGTSGYYDDRGYRDDRRYDDRRDGRRFENGYEVSADGYYYFDPRRGWLPR
jgi:hypothetical protein